MKAETLASYLERHLNEGVIDFSIRVQRQSGGFGVQFYIHPAYINGDTQDYLLWEEPLAQSDLLVHRDFLPELSFDQIRERIRKIGTHEQL